MMAPFRLLPCRVLVVVVLGMWFAPVFAAETVWVTVQSRPANAKVFSQEASEETKYWGRTPCRVRLVMWHTTRVCVVKQGYVKAQKVFVTTSDKPSVWNPSLVPVPKPSRTSSDDAAIKKLILRPGQWLKKGTICGSWAAAWVSDATTSGEGAVLHKSGGRWKTCYRGSDAPADHVRRQLGLSKSLWKTLWR